MARRTEQALDKLAGVRANPGSEEAAAELRKALGGRSSFVAAKAARIAGEARLAMLAGDLVAAFGRFLEDEDKGCEAKKAIIEALRAMEQHDRAAYLRGVRHVQREPVWGGSEDTAADLRAACALGLVDARAPEALPEAVRLLADKEPRARLGAVTALGSSGDPGAALVLRYKALAGDREADVAAECLHELMRVDRPGSFDFVAAFLDRDDQPALAEAAALALGESRDERAFEVLESAWNRGVDPDVRRAILLGIATLRRDEGYAMLAGIVRTGRVRDAAAALEALALFRTDEAVVRIAREALNARADRDLDAVAARVKLVS